MKYEPQYERLVAEGPGQKRYEAEFLRAGFLTLGDSPELYFFRLRELQENEAHGKEEEAVVGISGRALGSFEAGRRRLSREEKIDLAGLLLKQRIEAGKALDSQNLFIRDEELARLSKELGLPE